MALYYLDCETATTKERYEDYVRRHDLWRSTLKATRNADERAAQFATEPKMPHGDSPGRDTIVTIQFQKLSDLGPGEVAPLTILKEWELGGERAMLAKFEEMTSFFRLRWATVPVGYNLPFDLRFLRAKGETYGHLQLSRFSNTEWEKPHIDLHHWALLANSDAEIPYHARGELPNLFYGATLSAYSRKRGSGTAVSKLHYEKRYAAIEEYVRQEAAAFVELFGVLTETLPQHWKSVVAPRVGRGA